MQYTSARPYLVRGLAALLLCLGTATSQASESRQQWQQDIASGYSQLAADSTALAGAAANYCDSPNDETHERLNDDWKKAFLSWQRVRFVDFGPIEQNSLSWQFQFWPDAKNLVASKVRYWLNHDGAITAETVAGASVALKGFPAIEYLLSDPQFTGSSQALPAPRSCELLVAISQHIQANAQSVDTGWQQLRDHFISTEDYTETTVKAALTAMENISDRRLGGPMGLRGNNRRNAYLAEAWRSGNSLAVVHASLDGLQTLFLPGLEKELAATGNTQLSAEIESRFAEIQEDFDGLPEAMAPLLSEGGDFRHLQSLYIDVEQLRQLMTGDVATTLGVVRGFNSSDGD